MFKLGSEIRLVLILLIIGTQGSSQLIVNSNLTPAQLVNQLIDPSIVTSNIQFTGHNNQIGSFNSTASNIGINSGIIISSGNINDAIGPNNLPDAGVGFFRPGDQDLDALTQNFTFDAAYLEFDFVPSNSNVEFNFVFASEEYLEYVSSGVNDGFGFFLSGPGINGQYSNNSINLAKVPGTNTEITIDNINSIVNSQYYIDNGDGITGPQVFDPTVTQFDGLTTKIKASATVQCGETYHIKMVIADAGDDIYDSGVFIEAGSFSTKKETLTVVPTCNGYRLEAPTGYNSYVWNTGNPADTLYYLMVKGGDYYRVDIVNNFCNSHMDTLITDTITPISITPSISPETCPLAQNGEIIVSANGSFPPYQFNINHGAFSINNEFYNLDSDSTYTIIVIDDLGCSDTTYTIVGLKDSCKPNPLTDSTFVFVPNSFSPDNDGRNDYFSPSVIGLKEDDYFFYVYSRWGELIYRTSKTSDSWDGDFNNIPVQKGVYIWRIKGKKETDNSVFEKIGHVTVLR